MDHNHTMFNGLPTRKYAVSLLRLHWIIGSWPKMPICASSQVLNLWNQLVMPLNVYQTMSWPYRCNDWQWSDYSRKGPPHPLNFMWNYPTVLNEHHSKFISSSLPSLYTDHLRILHHARTHTLLLTSRVQVRCALSTASLETLLPWSPENPLSVWKAVARHQMPACRSHKRRHCSFPHDTATQTSKCCFEKPGRPDVTAN